MPSPGARKGMDQSALGADERIVCLIDDGGDAEKVIEYGFSRTVRSLDPCLIVREGFADDEDVGILPGDEK